MRQTIAGSGLCECGCGELTKPVLQTDTARGYVKGQPARFVFGHAVRLRRKPFETQFTRGQSDACWLWEGLRDKDGYGLVQHDGRLRRAHRVSYEVEQGAIPEGLQVLHRCDTPACVNPAHLFAGTNVDNMRDKVSKGRGHNGRGPCKLSLDLARQIRVLYAAGGISQAALGRKLGVSQTMIGMIVRGAAWREVGKP